jgi:hypothetical protein
MKRIFIRFEANKMGLFACFASKRISKFYMRNEFVPEAHFCFKRKFGSEFALQANILKRILSSSEYWEVNFGLTAFCPLPSVHCLLPTVHCPLPIVYCKLPTVYCSLFTVHCPLLFPTVYGPLSTVHCLLHCPKNLADFHR